MRHSLTYCTLSPIFLLTTLLILFQLFELFQPFRWLLYCIFLFLLYIIFYFYYYYYYYFLNLFECRCIYQSSVSNLHTYGFMYCTVIFLRANTIRYSTIPVPKLWKSHPKKTNAKMETTAHAYVPYIQCQKVTFHSTIDSKVRYFFLN